MGNDNSRMAEVRSEVIYKTSSKNTEKLAASVVLEENYYIHDDRDLAILGIFFFKKI